MSSGAASSSRAFCERELQSGRHRNRDGRFLRFVANDPHWPESADLRRLELRVWPILGRRGEDSLRRFHAAWRAER